MRNIKGEAFLYFTIMSKKIVASPHFSSFYSLNWVRLSSISSIKNKLVASGNDTNWVSQVV